MRLFVVLAAVLSLPAYGGEPLLHAQSRPFLNLREIVALVPQAGGLDAYWNHINELETPPFQRLMRTGLTSGGARQNASVILEGDVRSMGWAGGDAAPIVLSVHEDGTLRATAIGGTTSALEQPAGKIIAQYTTFPQLACGGGHCVAFWSWANSWHAVYLDEEGNPKGASFTLPDASMLFDVKVGQPGIFVVRRLSDDIRAALLRPDGSVQYDVLLFQSPAAEFAEPIVSAAFDGTSHVVAYAKRPPGNELKPTVVEAVTIAENGTFEAAHTVVDPEPLGIDSFSLAWNGAQHLLTWSSGGQLRASRYTPQLIALDPEPRLIGTNLWPGSVISPMPDGTFAIGWSRDGAPYAALLRPNGELTTPVALETTPRRRAAGK